MPTIRIHLNATRSGLDALPDARRREEASRSVPMFVLPRHPQFPMLDSMVPDILVTDDMIDRFLELDPPLASIIPEFQTIINEIEYSYVVGVFFATVSASCVTLERLLNLTRMELHQYHKPIKELWDKGPSNEWDENIAALEAWGYLGAEFARELRSIYTDIRCRYLHSQPIGDLAQDAARSARAAYTLLKIFLGFPDSLFRLGAGGFECLNTADPRYRAFYVKHVQPDGPSSEPSVNGRGDR